MPIQFKDRLKVEGLKVFQEMIFASGTPYELWWTGREFKDMRLEACEQMLGEGRAQLLNDQHQSDFDLAIGHFHDFCPVALARAAGVQRMIWITHGPSLYDFTAVSLGLRTFPAFVPHPLSSNSDRMSFTRRLINLLWHFSGIEFVNLPNELLYQEDQLYRKLFPKAQHDLWALGSQVDLLLLNGERFLDFPRPLPQNIVHLGAIGGEKKKVLAKGGGTVEPKLEADFEAIYSRNGNKGVILFSMGTVSNTTNMPAAMSQAFVRAFGQMREYDFLWKTEQTDLLTGPSRLPNVHLRRWIPQKQLITHPRTRLLLAHGGYNSFLEAAQAGVPVVLVPLFADQSINAERARRFGIAERLDKLALSAEAVEQTLRKVLADESYRLNARKLSAMLADKPPPTKNFASMPSLQHALKLATRSQSGHFALKAAQRLNFLQHYGLDLVLALIILAWMISRR